MVKQYRVVHAIFMYADAKKTNGICVKIDRMSVKEIRSDGVSRHVSRLETSRDTLHVPVSVLTQSRRIHVLSWLESCSSMSRLGSVSRLSWCVPNAFFAHDTYGLSTTVL